MRKLVLILGVLAAVCRCPAYIVAPARLWIVSSPDGSALLRIEPGNDSYHHDRPGNPPAQALVYKRNEHTAGYDLVKAFPLRNPVSPAKAVITNGAEFIATFDDWGGQVGCTPNVAVVYRGTGEVIKSWSLEDIFSADEIKRFPSYVNAPRRPWRGDNIQLGEFGPRGLIVYIPWAMENRWHVRLELDLATMAFRKFPE